MQVYSPVRTAAPTQPPYSLAGDVSSFKYSSPIVSYSNLGVIQQSVDKGTGPVHQEAPARSHYSQPPSEASYQIPQNSAQHSVIPTYSQPQQLIYRPKLQLPQISYNPALQQTGPVPSSAPPQKFIYSQLPQNFATVPRSQPVYSPSTQKLAASGPQQILYNVPQQVAYAPAPSHHTAQSAQPVQPAHSIPQPIYVVGPQYQLNDGTAQHA